MQILKTTIVFLIVLNTAIAIAGIEEYPEQVRKVSIVSSLDLSFQPALFFDPGNATPKPLLVALHTWSSHYDQGGGEVAYARWCIENDWVFIHPHFRGPNNNSKALGSEYVVSDILDAVNYAKKTANIDEKRIYLIGASGGGHAALLLAGRAPKIWAAVSTWCPIYDINQWWQEKTLENSQYAKQMAAACGGIPGSSAEVDHQFRIRSPKAWLNPELIFPIQIATGVHDGRDGSVPFTHALLAFNAVATPGDALTTEEVMEFYRTQSASHLGFEVFYDNLYRRNIHFRKTSHNCQITIFEGGHEIVHGAGLLWLSYQVKETKPVWKKSVKPGLSNYSGTKSGK
ncbi:prolyl oligopeptidase family serine peptidase [bacterium]|nr:prolyl oligopeptidase family serine peptidase [bacterium]